MNFIFLVVLFLNISLFLAASLDTANESSMNGSNTKVDEVVQSEKNDFMDDDDDDDLVSKEKKSLHKFLKENLEVLELDSKDVEDKVVSKRQLGKRHKNFRKAKNCLVHKKLCLFIG